MLQEITYFCKIDSSRQPAFIFRAGGSAPAPLLVALHTWSYGHENGVERYLSFCEEHHWNLIYPEFRGHNFNPRACGSQFVVSDLEDAVAEMKATTNVDPDRVYLSGGSGGGHAALLMAGRRPDLWTAVSAWCPISDLAAWHQQCKGNGNTRCYATDIEQSCGGDPERSAAALDEARIRSPLNWLPNAATLPVDINTGIHDGHTGSVPVSHAIRAFNVLAAPQDRIAEEEIRIIVEQERIPEPLRCPDTDPAYGAYTVYLRRQSRLARLTLFEGGHDILVHPALTWLARQKRGQAPDWSAGTASLQAAVNTQLAR